MHALHLRLSLASVYLPPTAHSARGLVLSGLGVAERAFPCNKVPPLAPSHLNGHQLRLLHWVLRVVGHVGICPYALTDSRIGAGPCGSCWDFGRLAIWVYLRKCTYMRTWTFCNVHLGKPLILGVLNGIKLCY